MPFQTRGEEKLLIGIVVGIIAFIVAAIVVAVAAAVVWGPSLSSPCAWVSLH